MIKNFEGIIPYQQDSFITCNTEYDFSYQMNIWQLCDKDIYKELLSKSLELKDRGFEVFLDRRVIFKSKFKKYMEEVGVENVSMDNMPFSIEEAHEDYDPLEVQDYHYDIVLSLGDKELSEYVDVLKEIISFVKNLKFSNSGDDNSN